MDFDINLTAGLVAGVAAMLPGSIIYSPPVLGRQWMKEIGTTPEKMKASGARSPAISMVLMLATALVSGLITSAVVFTIGVDTVVDAVVISLLLSWFAISVNLSQVFFEQRSWKWCGINVLNHFLTAVVVGVVLGLFIP